MKRSLDVALNDASDRQIQTLNYVLAEANEAKKKRQQDPKVSVTEARHDEAHFEIQRKSEIFELRFFHLTIILQSIYFVVYEYSH